MLSRIPRTNTSPTRLIVWAPVHKKVGDEKRFVRGILLSKVGARKKQRNSARNQFVGNHYGLGTMSLIFFRLNKTKSRGTRRGLSFFGDVFWSKLASNTFWTLLLLVVAFRCASMLQCFGRGEACSMMQWAMSCFRQRPCCLIPAYPMSCHVSGAMP